MDSFLKATSPTTSSFEETLKTAYSHGLEEIYSLEKIDISKVKPISVEPPKEKKVVQKRVKSSSAQLTFDFARDTLDPFYLEEPIQLLSLSRPLEKMLFDQGQKSIGDLHRGDFQVVGQGHKDEINDALEGYLKGKDLESGKSVDFFSLIRCLTGDQDLRKVTVALSSFHLKDVYSLSPLEKNEIKRLTEARKKEWISEFYTKLAYKMDEAKSKISDVFEVFLKPWIGHRLGLATEAELLERLERISENPEYTKNILKFFEAKIYNQSLFDVFFSKADEGLYCMDQALKERFSQLIAKAKSYFYKPHLRYSLPEFTLLLKQEFAIHWQGYDELFIERSLRLSPDFRVRKGEDGLLWVRLS